MAYKRKTIPMESKYRVKPNPLADQTLTYRGNSKSLSCYGGALIKHPVNGFGIKTAHSTAGAETKTLHAERAAIEKLANHFGSTKNRSGDGQGVEMGTFLQQNGVTKVRVFTELPPCPSCDRWLSDLGTRVAVTHYSFEELQEYSGLDKEAKETLMSTYVTEWLG